MVLIIWESLLKTGLMNTIILKSQNTCIVWIVQNQMTWVVREYGYIEFAYINRIKKRLSVKSFYLILYENWINLRGDLISLHAFWWNCQQHSLYHLNWIYILSIAISASGKSIYPLSFHWKILKWKIMAKSLSKCTATKFWSALKWKFMSRSSSLCSATKFQATLKWKVMSKSLS